MSDNQALYQPVLDCPLSARLSNITRRGNNVLAYGHTAPSLAPQALPITEQLAQQPSVAAQSPAEVRAQRRASGYPHNHSDVADMHRQDFLIPGPSSLLPARIYNPAPDSLMPQPGLVFFHGGGFVLGDIHAYDHLLAQLAYQSQVVVISVEYRLAPETPFPGAIEDAQSAYNWLYQHAQNFHLDPRRLAIGGDSAGANLAAATCLLNRDQERPTPALQLLFYPVIAGAQTTASRCRHKRAPVLPKKILDWFFHHYIDETQQNDPRFNLLSNKDLGRLPAAFILTCGFDPLLDEGETYAKLLAYQGVSVRHSCYSDMFHGFLNFGVLPQSQAAVAESAQVLAQCLDSVAAPN